MPHKIIYTLEELAEPSIVSVTGFAEQNSSTALVLFDNTGGRGYIRVKGLSDDALFEDNIVACFDNISPLLYFGELHFPRKLKGATASIFRCSSIDNQNCKTSPTCTDESLIGQGIPLTMDVKNDVVPDPIDGLTITPSDSALNIEWKPIRNINIFAYGVRILFQEQEILIGYVSGNTISVTISGLIGNRTYNIEVFGISTSNIKGVSSRKSAFLPLISTSIITFNITSVSGPTIGPVKDARIYIDGIDKGITDINGVLTILDIPSSSTGIPHDYSVVKQGFNDSIDTFIAFSGTNIIEPVIMGKFTPDQGSVIARVTCGGKPCQGTYVAIQRNVRAITGPQGNTLMEGILPRKQFVIAFKPGYKVGASTLFDVLPEKTITAPVINLIAQSEDFGYVGFDIFDINDASLPDVLVTVGEDSLMPTLDGFTYSDQILRNIDLPYTITKSGYDTVTGSLKLEGVGMYINVILYNEGKTPNNGVGTGSFIFTTIDTKGNPVDVVIMTVDDKYTFFYLNIIGGKYIFTNLSSGIHTYTAVKDGYLDTTGQVSIVPNETQNINIVMTPQPTIATLDNIKILTLNEMRNMHIDSIVQLYRDGYRLEDLKITSAQVSESLNIGNLALLIISGTLIGLYLIRRTQ